MNKPQTIRDVLFLHIINGCTDSRCDLNNLNMPANEAFIDHLVEEIAELIDRMLDMDLLTGRGQ